MQLCAHQEIPVKGHNIRGAVKVETFFYKDVHLIFTVDRDC